MTTVNGKLGYDIGGQVLHLGAAEIDDAGESVEGEELQKIFEAAGAEVTVPDTADPNNSGFVIAQSPYPNFSRLTIEEQENLAGWPFSMASMTAQSDKAKLQNRISFASTDDIEGILAVQAENILSNIGSRGDVVRESGFLMYPLTADELKGIILDNAQQYILLVAKIGSRVVGYTLLYTLASWQKRDPDWRQGVSLDANSIAILDRPDVWYGRHMAVIKSVEAKDVGRDLAATREQKVMERNGTVIIADILEKPVANVRSSQFAIKRGYVRVGTLLEKGGVVCGIYLKYLATFFNVG